MSLEEGLITRRSKTCLGGTSASFSGGRYAGSKGDYLAVSRRIRVLSRSEKEEGGLAR